MLVTLAGIVTLVRLWQLEKARSPMLMTLFGIVTLVRPVQLWNAEAAMPVTGRPSIMLGMVTTPPEPVYLVIVTSPALAVYE